MSHSLRLSSTLSASLILIVLGAGCGNTASQPAGSSSPTASTGQINACANPYYPLRPGYRVTYQNSANGRATNYTMEAEDAGSSDQIKLKTTYDGGNKSEQLITCGAGGLKTSGFADFNTGLNDRHISSESKRVEGDFLPPDLHVGTSWIIIYDVTLKNSDPAMVSAGLDAIDATYTVTKRVLNQDRITVPAGTFDAFKVSSLTTVKFHNASNKATTPASTIDGTEWWVKGKGMMKTIVNAPDGTPNIVSEATEVITP